MIKSVLKLIPIRFTKNQEYDFQTKKIIAKVCKADSHCIDIGCHKGEILDLFLQYAPKGTHYAFEPIPSMYNALLQKYQRQPCVISNVALSNVNGEASFNHVTSNPGYSGLQKRAYKNAHEAIEVITVRTEPLDTLLPSNIHITIMKIDVEGGELHVLKGALATIKRCKLIIIFEHGLGASEFYGARPAKLFQLLTDCGLHIATLKKIGSSKSPPLLYMNLNNSFCKDLIIILLLILNSFI